MQFLIPRRKFDRLIFSLLVILFSLATFFLTYRNFNVRFVSDPRFSIEREGLISLSHSIPNSSRLNNRIAESYLQDAASSDEAANLAQRHAELASLMSLWNYRIAYTLGTILELNGDLARAETALRNSVRLSPNNKQANWALGGLLLRQGRREEAILFLRNASRIDPELYPVLFDQFQVADNTEPHLIEILTAADPVATLTLAHYLAERSQVDRAVLLFNSVDQNVKNESTLSSKFLTTIIDSGHIYLARQLWGTLQPGSTGTTSSGIWNGDFEQSSKLETVTSNELDSLFNWSTKQSPFARFGIDAVSAGTGSQSLRLTFLGRDTTLLRDDFRQLVAVKQGGRYRLEFFFRTKDLRSTIGPSVAIVTDSRIIAQSAPIPAGTSDSWIYSTFEFSAQNDNQRTYVAVIRQPAFTYDEPTSGYVWLDNFTLTEIPGAATKIIIE